MEWCSPGDPPPHKFQVQKSAGKVMGIFFWDCNGLIYVNYLEKGTTVTGTYYAQVLGKLHAALVQNRHGKLS